MAKEQVSSGVATTVGPVKDRYADGIPAYQFALYPEQVALILEKGTYSEKADAAVYVMLGPLRFNKQFLDIRKQLIGQSQGAFDLRISYETTQGNTFDLSEPSPRPTGEQESLLEDMTWAQRAKLLRDAYTRLAIQQVTENQAEQTRQFAEAQEAERRRFTKAQEAERKRSEEQSEKLSKRQYYRGLVWGFALGLVGNVLVSFALPWIQYQFPRLVPPVAVPAVPQHSPHPSSSPAPHKGVAPPGNSSPLAPLARK